MATYVEPFCQIHGYDFSSIVHAEGESPSGGGAGVEEIQVPGSKYGDVRPKGRSPKKYKIRTIPTKDRELVEAFLAEVNTAPDGARIWPFDAERSGLIASATGGLRSADALDKRLFVAEAEVSCRESWLYGPARGILYREVVSLPVVSGLLTNEGQEAAGLDYLLARGNLAEDLSVRLTPDESTSEHDKEIALCDKTMRGDVFRLDQAGNVEHSYDSSFDQTYASLVADLHGSTFVTGGSISSGLVLGASGKFLMPFYGPLPACQPVLELWVSAITGTPDVEVAFETDLSDLAVVDFTPKIGYNKISIPDCEGADFVAFGIVTGSGEGVTLTRARGTVARYLAASAMPTIDVGEDFKIRVEATAGGLRAVQATYRDLFYY